MSHNRFQMHIVCMHTCETSTTNSSAPTVSCLWKSLVVTLWSWFLASMKSCSSHAELALSIWNSRCCTCTMSKSMSKGQHLWWWIGAWEGKASVMCKLSSCIWVSGIYVPQTLCAPWLLSTVWWIETRLILYAFLYYPLQLLGLKTASEIYLLWVAWIEHRH